MAKTKIRLDRAIAHYLASIKGENYSPRTVDLYDRVLTRFCRRLGESPAVEDVNVDTALEFQLFLQGVPRNADHPFKRSGGALSPEYVNLNCRILRSFSSWLQRHKYLKDNVLKDFRPGKVPYREIVPLSPDEQRGVVACLKGESYEQARGMAICLTLLDTGLRASELCHIEVEDCDPYSGEVRVREGKGARDRHVAVGVRTLAAIHAYVFQHRPDPAPAVPDRLYLSRDGYPMDRKSLYQVIRRLRRRAGIRRLTTHLFRHTFAVSYLKNGGDVLTLQRILGHRSLKMVNHYMHLASSDVVERHRRYSPVDRLQLPRGRRIRRQFKRSTVPRGLDT